MKHKIKNFRYLSLSDIHLGHNTNKTENILANLDSFIIDYDKDISKVDAIFFVGDLFDKLLSNTHKDYILASRWFSKLILFCSLKKIKIRVLEGTPSHDWGQFKLIMQIIDKLGLDIDLKYIDTLHIEHMDEFNIDILYIPDEYKHDANDTYQDVLKLLKEHNLSKVDIGMIHGAFKYQLPVELKSSHVEEYYLNLVRYFISVGHIHIPSVYSRIVVQGSFDRLCHGEEEDKGAMLFHIGNDIMEYKFLKNKNSMIFKTFKYENVDDVEVIILDLNSKLKKIPYNSSIRILVEDSIYLTKSVKLIEERYKNYRLKVEGFKYNKSLIMKDKLVYDGVETESFQITNKNITELLTKEMEKYNLPINQMDIFKNELINVLNSI